jgi:hypothetical protein
MKKNSTVKQGIARVGAGKSNRHLAIRNGCNFMKTLDGAPF